MKNNLEDIFKVLQDHAEEAPDLMAAIHAKRSTPMHRLKLHLRSNFLRYAAAIVVLLSISFFMFNDSERIQENPGNAIAEDSSNMDRINPNSTDKTNNNSQLGEQPSENKNLDDYTQIKDGSDNYTKSTKIEPTIKSNSTIDQVETYPIDPNQTPSTEPEADQQNEKIADQPPVQSSEDDQDASNDQSKERIIVDDNTNDQKKDDQPIVTIEDQGKSDKKDEKIEDNSSEDKNKEIIPDPGNNIEDPIVDDKKINNNNSIANDSSIADHSKNNTIPDIPNKSYGLKKFSIEILAGVGKVGSGIYSENEYSGIRNASEKPMRSFQASVLFNYELLNNLELQTGLNYNSSRFDVDYLNKYTKTNMNITSKDVLIFDYPGAPGRKVTLHDTTYSTEDVEDEYRSSNLIQSYQVPLSLRVHYPTNKKFSGFAKVGVNLEMHKTLEGKVLNPDYSWAQLGSDAYIRRDFLSSYQFGLGANYVLSNRIAFVFEYLTQRSLKSIWTSSSPVDELQINNSIKAGFKFNF